MFSELDPYTKETVYSLPSGEAVFAGPREDGFFADTPGIFDLLDPRIVLPVSPSTHPPLAKPVTAWTDSRASTVLAYAIQIPLTSLPLIPYNAPFSGPFQGVGVYASVSRPRVTIRSPMGAPMSEGPFVQINRMGNPLFNEVLVALKDKDSL